MVRKIIQIDENKCNGCGLCADACHEGAIAMVDGKARLLRDDYCDGLGDCLPVCPTDAITFVEREAAAYDKAAVEKNMRGKAAPAGGCPGSRAHTIPSPQSEPDTEYPPAKSRLRQWPVQLKLVPVKAPFFAGADLLVAADCTAFARGDFHDRFLKGRVLLIGCPKLDAVQYGEKLTEILRENDIRSVTVVRMEVPCCGGIAFAAETALRDCGKDIPLEIVTLGTDGRIVGAG